MGDLGLRRIHPNFPGLGHSRKKKKNKDKKQILKLYIYNPNKI